MTSLKLPTIYAERSIYFKNFEIEFEALNDFYWLFRASSALLQQEAQSHERITDFVPQPEAAHFDISSGEIAKKKIDGEKTARHSMLLQVITYYEVYIEEVLVDLIKRKWPIQSQITLKINPRDLPLSSVEDYIKEQAIASKVDGIIKSNYTDRSKQVYNLLKECGFNPKKDDTREILIFAACEARNCIVHTGGVIDSRAHKNLSGFIPGLVLNSKLHIDEALLWRFLGAIRDDVRAIDHSLREKISQQFVKKVARRQRAAANRKQRRLAQAARFR